MNRTIGRGPQRRRTSGAMDENFDIGESLSPASGAVPVCRWLLLGVSITSLAFYVVRRRDAGWQNLYLQAHPRALRGRARARGMRVGAHAGGACGLWSLRAMGADGPAGVGAARTNLWRVA